MAVGIRPGLAATGLRSTASLSARKATRRAERTPSAPSRCERYAARRITAPETRYGDSGPQSTVVFKTTAIDHSAVPPRFEFRPEFANLPK